MWSGFHCLVRKCDVFQYRLYIYQMNEGKQANQDFHFVNPKGFYLLLLINPQCLKLSKLSILFPPLLSVVLIRL
jgi:hypothetical protein